MPRSGPCCLLDLLQGINRCLCVCNKQILDCLHRAKALNYGGYLEACLLKLGLPGAVLVACHIVIGVVACNDLSGRRTTFL